MKLSTWRSSFIEWLETKITIDSYYLEEPEAVGDTSVFLPPLRNIRVFEADSGFIGVATQDVWITTRYSRDLSYQELPITLIEGTYNSIAYYFAKECQGIADLIDGSVNSSEDSIFVGEWGEGRGDWIVRMKFIFNFSYISEPEEDDATIIIDRIQLGIYRPLLDESGEVLDYTYTTGDVFTDLDSGLVDDQGNLLID